MAAALSGVLVRDPSGCLRVNGIAIVWPAGYTASVLDDGIVVVLNGDGREAARTGMNVELGGGGSAAPEGDSCSTQGAWIVQDDLPEGQPRS